MNCKIIYLKPHSSYRPAMRSDTLWGALCWGIRYLYGEDDLKKFIAGYSEETTVAPFYISSAFPYLEQYGTRHHFLPHPLEKSDEMPLPDEYTPAKKAIRERKQYKKKREGMINLADFESYFCGASTVASFKGKPKLEISPVTHNTIDRTTGSTLSINGNGQLFHTEERFVYDPKNPHNKGGLYFLAKGNTVLLESVLRFLEHFGIGGDRTIGKGRFDIEMKDFDIAESPDANASMTLSLYHPTEAELEQIEKQADHSSLQYKTVVRQGWRGQSGQPKKPVLYFEEGSIFPLETVEIIAGRNIGSKVYEQDGEIDKEGKIKEETLITKYGHGFMLNIKIPT